MPSRPAPTADRGFHAPGQRVLPCRHSYPLVRRGSRQFYGCVEPLPIFRGKRSSQPFESVPTGHVMLV